MIGINNPDFSRPDFAVDYVLSCIFIGFGVFLNCQLFWFIFKYKPLVALRDSKFYVKYNSLFDEFKNDKGFFSMCYYPLYLARRLIFLITLYNLADYPLVQLLINIILGSISAGHILKYKPFKDLYLNKVNFVAELLVTTCMVLLIPYTIEDLSNLTQEMLQSILILITVIFLFYSYVLLIKDIIMKLINAIKKYRLKKISVIKVTDIKSNDNTLTNRNREDLEDDVKGAETTQFVNSQKLKEFF